MSFRRFRPRHVAPLYWSIIDVEHGAVVAILDDTTAETKRLDAEMEIQARIMADGLNDIYEAAAFARRNK